MGIVTNQAEPIDRKVCQRTDFQLLTSPTPTTAPTKAWEVETGNPKRDANNTVAAVANSAQNPPLGCNWMMPSPTVAITFSPQRAKPMTIPTPPRTKIHRGTVKSFRGKEPVRRILTIAAKGATALPTSLEPWQRPQNRH